jgi:hypothetical protein
MSVLSKLSHPAWTGLILPLALGVGSTFSPNIVRLILLAAMIVAITWTFYLTEFGGKNFKKTVLLGVLSTVLAIAVFALGRRLDARATRFAPIINQNAIDSSCSNIVSGGDAKINCPSTENDHAQAKP